jgi:hypothetical protein
MHVSPVNLSSLVLSCALAGFSAAAPLAAYSQAGCGLLAPLRAASGPLSVVFVIDNSGSMDESDAALRRFSIVRAVLDSLATFAPGSEAALAPVLALRPGIPGQAIGSKGPLMGQEAFFDAAGRMLGLRNRIPANQSGSKQSGKQKRGHPAAPPFF